MKHKITPRQLMALLACYHGQRATYYAGSVYGSGHEKAGQPVWYSRTNMGGAAGRMAEELRERGFITDYNRHEEFGDKSSSDLTVIGYEAIEERIGKLPKLKDVYGNETFDFNTYLSVVTLRERKEARRQREAEMVRLRAEQREREREIAERRRQRDREKLLARFRQLLKDYGIADNWSDDQVLRFAEQAGDALHAA
jgi:hypothetical protein